MPSIELGIMPVEEADGGSKVHDVKLVDDITPQVGSEQHAPANDTKDESGSATSTPASAVAADTTTTCSSRRPVVAVDLDEVLGHFVPQLCSFHNDTYGTSLTPEAFTCYDFHRVWGGTKQEADDKMRLFFKSSYFLRNGRGIPVIDGANEILKKHVGQLELHIVTSRQNILEEHTRDWVEAHFPDIFRKLHFGNHHGTQGEVRSKPDLCRAIGAVMMIDDNVRYATQCAEAGIRTCLFGDYAWNRGGDDDLPSNVQRTFSWAEVDAALQSLSSVDCTTAGEGGDRIAAGGGDGDEEGAADDDIDADALGGENGISEPAVDGVTMNAATGIPVIAVEASKTVASLVELASSQLVRYESVCLRSLEKAVMVGVDTVQELERLGIAVKAQVRTSLVELSSGSRTCVEVTVKRTPEFVQGLVAPPAKEPAATAPEDMENVVSNEPVDNDGSVGGAAPAVGAAQGSVCAEGSS